MLRLYLRAECQLCEEAWTLLQAAGIAAEVQSVDIDDDVELALRFGWLIPVLERADGATLQWPFGAADIAQFVR